MKPPLIIEQLYKKVKSSKNKSPKYRAAKKKYTDYGMSYIVDPVKEGLWTASVVVGVAILIFLIVNLFLSGFNEDARKCVAVHGINATGVAYTGAEDSGTKCIVTENGEEIKKDFPSREQVEKRAI